MTRLMLDAAHRLAHALSALRPDARSAISVHSLTPDGRSWLLHAEQWWPDVEVRALWASRPLDPTKGRIMGRDILFPRRTAAFGVDYKYTGQTQMSRPLDEAPEAVHAVVDALQQVDSRWNALLLNWYEACDREYMGPHSDDERELVGGAPIVSLSWCSPGHYRRFRLTPKRGVKDALQPGWGHGPGVLHLHHGCLVVMGGACQRTHKHEVMKPTKALGECEGRRINLTLRAFGDAAARSSVKRRHEDLDSSPETMQPQNLE